MSKRKRVTRKQATLVAVGIGCVILTLTTHKAWATESGTDVVTSTESGICYDPANPSAPPMACPKEPSTSLVPVPTDGPVVVAPPYTGPQLATTTVVLAPPLVVVSPATTTDICGDYGDKAACAAVVAEKFGPAKSTSGRSGSPKATQRTTTHHHNTKPRTTTTTVHSGAGQPSPATTWTHDELFAFVEAFIAPLFTSYVP